AEDGIRDKLVTGVQTCALPISSPIPGPPLVSGSPDLPVNRSKHDRRPFYQQVRFVSCKARCTARSSDRTRLEAMSEMEGMRSQGSHEHRELRRADLDPDPISQFLRWF